MSARAAAVVFDLDRTLCRPTRPFEQVFLEIMGVEFSPAIQQAWMAALERPGSSHGAEIVAELHPNLAPSRSQEMASALAKGWAASQRLFEGVEATLVALRQADHSLGIITNGPSLFQHAVIEHLGLEEIVDTVIVSGDAGVGWRKPDSRIFTAMAARLGRPPAELVMIGDNLETDIAGGLSAGWAVAWIHAVEGERAVGIGPREVLRHAKREKPSEPFALVWSR